MPGSSPGRATNVSRTLIGDAKPYPVYNGHISQRPWIPRCANPWIGTNSHFPDISDSDATGVVYHCPPPLSEQEAQRRQQQQQNEAVERYYESPLFQDMGRYKNNTFMMWIYFAIVALESIEEGMSEDELKKALAALSDSLRSLASVARTKGVEDGAPILAVKLATASTKAADDLAKTTVGGRLQGNVSHVLSLALQTLTMAFKTYDIEGSQDEHLVSQLSAAITRAKKLETSLK